MPARKGKPTHIKWVSADKRLDGKSIETLNTDEPVGLKEVRACYEPVSIEERAPIVLSAEERRWVHSLGTAEEIWKLMDQSGKDLDALFRLERKLAKEHPDQWVAFFRGEVVGFADTLGDLIALIEAKGLPRIWVLKRFLRRKKLTLVL